MYISGFTFYSKWYQDNNNNKYLDSTYCLPGCSLDALQMFTDWIFTQLCDEINTIFSHILKARKPKQS